MAAANIDDVSENPSARPHRTASTSQPKTFYAPLRSAPSLARRKIRERDLGGHCERRARIMRDASTRSHSPFGRASIECQRTPLPNRFPIDYHLLSQTLAISFPTVPIQPRTQRDFPLHLAVHLKRGPINRPNPFTPLCAPRSRKNSSILRRPGLDKVSNGSPRGAFASGRAFGRARRPRNETRSHDSGIGGAGRVPREDVRPAAGKILPSSDRPTLSSSPTDGAFSLLIRALRVVDSSAPRPLSFFAACRLRFAPAVRTSARRL